MSSVGVEETVCDVLQHEENDTLTVASHIRWDMYDASRMTSRKVWMIVLVPPLWDQHDGNQYPAICVGVFGPVMERLNLRMSTESFQRKGNGYQP